MDRKKLYERRKVKKEGERFRGRTGDNKKEKYKKIYVILFREGKDIEVL